jgi:hypothetical protein
MLRTAIVGVLALTATASAVPTSAEARVRAGVLQCRGAGSTSFVVGSIEQLSCVFRPSEGKPQAYSATVRRYGVDLGFTNRTEMTWVVFTSSQHVSRGDLAGVYGGISAGATVGVGAGANVLVGGSRNSIALQPLSLQGQMGLNLAAGVARLELRAGR